MARATRAGHAIVLGAKDRRLRRVVAQVPTTSGYEAGLRRIPPEGTASIEETFTEDERAQVGEPPKRQAVISVDPNVSVSYLTKDAIDFYLQPIPEGLWENNVIVCSTRAARMYELGLGIWISRISPTPCSCWQLLRDTVTLTDLALAAYERALQPKRLVMIEGDHFDPYLSQFKQSSRAALEWFCMLLGGHN